MLAPAPGDSAHAIQLTLKRPGSAAHNQQPEWAQATGGSLTQGTIRIGKSGLCPPPPFLGTRHKY